ITCPANLASECASSIPAPDIAGVTATDNCLDVSVVHLSDSSNGNPGCPGNALVISRTYRATDGNGNFADCVQTFTITKVTPPTLSCPFTNLFLFIDEGEQAVAPNLVLSNAVADVCDSNSVIVSQTPPPGTLLDFGHHTFDIVATDPCGLTDNCSVRVSVTSTNIIIYDADLHGPNISFTTTGTGDAYQVEYTTSIIDTQEVWMPLPGATGLVDGGIVSFDFTKPPTNAPRIYFRVKEE
ncbi:MAG: HYR domain-containing protein, partial [Verrucomicrobiota bacterium]